MARAALQAAHGRLAAGGEWVLNEKGLLRRADLHEVDAIVAGVADPRDAVAEAWRLLALPVPPELERRRRPGRRAD